MLIHGLDCSRNNLIEFSGKLFKYSKLLELGFI